MSEDLRHPNVYNEFDIERARKAGEAWGEAKERKRLLRVINARRAELHDALATEQTDCERSLDWVARLLQGTDEQES